MLLDSVTEERTGKVKHGVGNTAGTLLTFFSNIDTDKKRSARYLANRTYSEGSTTYHAYISYVDSKVAERRRVKDEDGNKSIETGDYYQRWKEINPFAKHLITLNGDTVPLFNIEFRLKEDHFTKMWNGKDPDTVDSLPPAFNNFARFEMDMKGNIDDSTFILTTSGEGHIKRISINGNDAMTFYSNGEPDGVLSHRNLNERQFKIVTLLCLLSDQYFQYK